MENEKLTVLVVEPEKKPYVKEISSSLDSLQKEVGGFIEAVYPFEDPVAIICDDEAKLKGSQLNRALRDDDGNVYDILAGTFIMTGLGETDFASMSEDMLKKYSEHFGTPEAFINLGGHVMVVPITARREKSAAIEVDRSEKKLSVMDKLKSISPQVGGGTKAKFKTEVL